jgi:hypothetical protein
MSIANAKQPDKSDLAKRMLEDLADAPVRAEIRAPRPAPTPAPVVASPLAAPVPVVAPVSVANPMPVVERAVEEIRPDVVDAEPARRETRRRAGANVQRKVDFEVSTGQGTRHLTLRVPKDLAGDLSLLAMKNKLAENGQPTTINDLGIAALQKFLREAA